MPKKLRRHAITRPVGNAKTWLNAMPRLIFVSDMGDALSEDRYVHEADLEEYQDDQDRRHFRPAPGATRRGGVPSDSLEREIMEPATSELGLRHIWLWITKRPGRMAELAEWRDKPWPANAWPGTSVTLNKTIDRIGELAEVGDFTTTRFLSIEPLWEEISTKDRMLLGQWWIITGGESRQRVRPPKPFDLGWARQLRDECRELGFPFFVKQLGGAPEEDGRPLELRLDRGHGGNWEEWPEDLRVREIRIVEGLRWSSKRVTALARQRQSPKQAQEATG